MRNSIWRFLPLLLAFTTLVPAVSIAQTNIKVVQYNLLRYGANGIGGCTPTGVTARNAWFSAIMNELTPDVFGVNEIGPFSGPTSPANNVLLNILKPINTDYAAATVTFSGNQDIANAFFYNSAKLGLKSQAVIPHSFRNIDYYKLYYKGPGLATGDTTFLEFVVVHLSADDAGIRASQTSTIMNYLDAFGRPANVIIMGDMNMDGSGATAYQNMVAHANTNTKVNDPINLNGTWSNNNNAKHAWSQSTRNSGSNDCGSGGGLDDRFDMILPSNSIMNNTDNIRYVPGSFRVVGNPNAPNPAVPSGVSAALVPMSDHHPVMLTLEVSRLVSTSEPMPGFEFLLRGQPSDQSLEATLVVPAGLEGDWSITIRDLQGRELLQERTHAEGNHNISVPTHQLKSGIYLLQLQAPDQSVVTRRISVIHP